MKRFFSSNRKGRKIIKKERKKKKGRIAGSQNRKKQKGNAS